MGVPTLVGRWGMVEYAQEDVLSFPRGIIGFPEVKQYILTALPGTMLSALQAVDRPGLAFILVEAAVFGEGYGVKGSDGRDGSAIYCIVTIPDDPAQMTANLRAPVIIDRQRRHGEQIILDEPYPVRFPLVFPQAGPQAQASKLVVKARTG